MSTAAVRYRFQEPFRVERIESMLAEAIWSTESLHGECATRLEAGHLLDETTRELVIDADTPIGMDLNRLFVGLMMRHYGPDVFSVDRVPGVPCGDLFQTEPLSR